MQEAALVEATFGVSAKLVCHSNYTAVRQVRTAAPQMTERQLPFSLFLPQCRSHHCAGGCWRKCHCTST